MLALVTLALALGLAQTPGFRRDIAPLLERNCLPCHNAQKAAANLRFDTAAQARKAIVAGQPEQSPLWTTMESAPGRPKAMPPGGPQVPAAQRALVRQWIASGAAWPADLVLGRTAAAPRLDEKALVEQLHKRIAAAAGTDPAKPYKAAIPGTVVSFEMMPVPGGRFSMGSTRKPDEQPVHEVTVEPFWMQKTEVTWDEYRLFMFAQQAGETPGQDTVVDAVSRPTRPYVEMSFGMGINGYPAISMTHHAASKYAQWLSARTGHFYRLPTEAEWEYACRAGSTAEAPPNLADSAWFADNANGKYEQVGRKKPNAWGLHDMLGNVMEWTLDQYVPDYRQWTFPFVRSKTPYPHTARGGSWNDDAAGVRCAVRVASDASWKMQDPQLPKSIWYHTDAQWLGFRLVRPVTVPSAAELFVYWNNGVEKE